MAWITIGRCYGVVGWSELEPKGQRGKTHVALYSLNLRLPGQVGFPRLKLRPYTPGFGRLAEALFWEFCELVAATPLRGRAVHRDGELVVPMDDVYIAARLGVSVGLWRRVAEALLCGSGIGVLEWTGARIKVDGEVAEGYEQRRANGQFSLFFPDGLAQNRTELKERKKKPNRTEPNRTGRRIPDESEKPLCDRHYEECRRACRHGESGLPAAEDAWLQMLTQLLGFAEESEQRERDLMQWRQMFGRLWTLLARATGQPPTPADRAHRLAQAYQEARRINLDGTVEKPPALFATWARDVGLMPKRR